MTLENIVYGDLNIGDTARLSKKLTVDVLQGFAKVTGDNNPVHLVDDYAKSTIFKQKIGHGLWSASLISAVLGTKLPGPGTIYIEQSLQFLKPVFVSDVVTAKLEVIEKLEGARVVFDCNVINQKGEIVLKGIAKVIAPTSKVVVVG